MLKLYITMRLPSGQRKLQQRRPLVLTIVLSSIMLALVAYHGRLLSALHVRQLRIRLPPGPATACSVPFEHQPYCKAIHARGCARRIAVVGNGPITEEQRTEINTQYDAVVRLNSLNNWYNSPPPLCIRMHTTIYTRMCNDALTVWLLETAPADSAHPYRGLQQLPLCTTTRAGAAAHHVWLVGGANSSFPTVQWSRAPVLHLDLASWRQLYMKTVSDGTPSIGWIGTRMCGCWHAELASRIGMQNAHNGAVDLATCMSSILSCTVFHAPVYA